MAVNVKRQVVTTQERVKVKAKKIPQETKPAKAASPPAHGVIYSKRLNFCPFSTPPLKDYVPILGDERTERLQRAAERLKGCKVLELNATAQGGGVAEMLYSSVPFLNELGVETEWKVISGNDSFLSVPRAYTICFRA